MKIIECKNLTLGYEGEIIVKDLSFTVESGDYLCIVGENGSGKSTLVKALIGAKKPISGSIEFFGQNKNKSIGYLPQQSGINRDFPASVKEIVMTGLLSDKKFGLFYTKEQKAIARKNMERLEIADMANKSFGKLSGGQQQRVLLARALCAAQEILLLDEPVAGLDPTVTKEFYEIISRLNGEGIAVIMVTHDISTALIYANKVLHISKENSYFSTTEEYIKDAQNQNIKD